MSQRRPGKSTLAKAAAVRTLDCEPSCVHGAAGEDMNRLKLIGVLSSCGLMCTAVHAESCVSMLADVSTGVTVADTASAKAADWWPVQLLQCLTPRKVLALQSGAHATLFFPANGTAMELRGVSRYEILQDTARPLANAPAPDRRTLNAAFREIQLDRSNLSSAGVRMRLPGPAAGPTPLAPRGVVVSSEPLVFRWEAVAGNPRYHFQLARGRAEVLYETSTDGAQVMLPADVRLAPGERFMWRVDLVSPTAKLTGRWQEFVLANEAARELAAQIDRDVPTPSAAERNLRDVLLLQRIAPGQ